MAKRLSARPAWVLLPLPRRRARAGRLRTRAYQNPDGEFGHALEPDLRGPESQPVAAEHALRILDEVNRFTGLTGSERLDIVALLSGHVRSLAQQTGANDDQAGLIHGTYRDGLAAAGERFPTGNDATLDLGIARIRDGLAALLSERS